MAKEFYMRTVQTGRYFRVARYTRALPGDSKSVRAAKQASTNAAQKFINIKNTTERLSMLLETNFDRKDESCFCTFTFRPGEEPANQKHTISIFSSYVRKLRPYLQKDGRLFQYIYTVEGTPLKSCPSAARVDDLEWEKTPWRQRERWEQLDSKAQDEAQGEEIRLHVHCFLNLREHDYDAVRAMWPYGQVFISRMKVNEKRTFTRLASYVTKEKRSDKKGNGSRAYITSLNIKQPDTNGHWCAAHEGIVIPDRAEVLEHSNNSEYVYGTSVEYLYYRLPRPQQLPEPYKGKGKIKGRPEKSRPKEAE